MLKVSRLVAIMAIVSACVSSPVGAAGFELSGAWASHQDLCNQVFSREGGQIAFAELSDLFGSGFIVDGNRIRGKSGSCTIEKRTQDNDMLELSAACASTIMTQSLQFKLRILDDNNLVRSFSEIPGMTLNYARCRF
jgi:hypothetical protein